MLSHLRFHRRNPSNPTSPLPDQPGQWETTALHEHPKATRDVSPRPDARPRSSNSSSVPPFLPPIARVTSSESDPAIERREEQRPVSQDSRSPPHRPPHNGSNSSFIGGVALQNFRRGLQTSQRPGSAGNPQSSVPDVSRPPPPPVKSGFPGEPPPVPAKAAKATSSFITPTDLQPPAMTGKRPAGTRLASEPASLAPPTTIAEAQRGKKGLPFLKNPMSTLLMRRRTSQNAPDILPLPLNAQVNEPTYDPRIRGTRVHDFSAPRPRKIVSNADAGLAGSTTKPEAYGDLERSQLLSGPKELPDLPPHLSRKPVPRDGKAIPPEVSATKSPDSDSQKQGEAAGRSLEQQRHDSRRMSFDHKPLPEQPLPPLPLRDDGESSLQASSSTASRGMSIDAPSTFPKSSPSTKASFSRNVSLSGASFRSSKSAIPRHMKSTSSRFSFDMIGAAKQEKLLEERHRQRQLEKGSDDNKSHRDSRFDDLDDFDYDAMMDDDGFEERIPGVNVDFDEEEIPGIAEEDEDNEGATDPDNDQENFAGFVFQRSNPPSSLTSPHTPGMLATPRDHAGKVIGFAMTKDTTPDLQPSASPFYLPDPSAQLLPDDSVAGLAIQGLGIVKQTLSGAAALERNKEPTPASAGGNPMAKEDDLYFDDGLADELDFENDGTHFDESLFDLNDTDQYGRPIPGVFAQAKSMSAAKQEAAKRESGITSRLSAQSALSQSTAHTSLSVEPPPAAQEKGEENLTCLHQETAAPQQAQPLPTSGLDKVAAYQAALAEAAHKAAASGKFRRDSSPPPPADLTVTSPTDSSESRTHSHPDPSPREYQEDGTFSADLDDFDFDDEAIIAEANASALANDPDGFYGQEFGFYSTPPPQGHHHHGHHPPSSVPSIPPSGHAALSAENLYYYANGGYFGPAGMPGVKRTTSGRVVSREPNLTPITERSEYSNRNSIMSLAVPPGIGGGASANSALASPGLAQLAMMADDDNMSLSAFLRLRAKAFNGSQVSLASSSRDGSPRSDRGGLGTADGASSPWGSGFLGVGSGTGLGHGRKNSAFSVWSRDSDAGSGSGSPTLTMAMPVPVACPPVPMPAVTAGVGVNGSAPAPNGLMPPPLFSQTQPSGQQSQPVTPGIAGGCPPVLEDEEAIQDDPSAAGGGLSSMTGSGVWMKGPGKSRDKDAAADASTLSNQPPQPQPQQPPGRRPGMGHRHKGSADSISYTKEEESSGETRWVVERRRTAESGEVEILGREVVEGGRI